MAKSIIFISIAALSITSTIARQTEYRRDTASDGPVDLAARENIKRLALESVVSGLGNGIGSNIAYKLQNPRELAAEDEVEELAARGRGGVPKFLAKAVFRGVESGLGSGGGGPQPQPNSQSTQPNQPRELAGDDEVDVFERELEEYLEERDLEDIELYLD